ncbi:hypothetical protein P154DRAFT_600959 [Amniculicola lignicola CBS 123094]|uniref:Ubiquitin-conjugating enzyme E2-binding protein n=1 Tax=Amniculicola lignicola CBS 123094 TaxID=1392246 RepID=A0A6A5WJZ8_9PLEO|nr:hypothetical protein P154DRAFT_600959 [Amniculicola lignicola CBS 123094]
MLPASAFAALELPSDTVKILTTPKPPPKEEASPNLMQAGSAEAASPAVNETSIMLYAELLLHIRTVTFLASLRTFHTHETKARLSSDGNEITIEHEGESATIRLPIKVKAGEGGDAALSLPAKPPSKELTLRLQMEEKDDSDLFQDLLAEERKANFVPWDGASLGSLSKPVVACKECGTTIVESARLSEWRDLPNENWAEMMDFWHCHKPDEHHLHEHTHEDATGSKGYAAGNRLKARGGIGFVDLGSFLLTQGDCANIQLTFLQPSPHLDSLSCKTCSHPLGAKDSTAEGWRIWKWSIAVVTSLPSLGSSLSPPTTYSTQKWISARLLSLIENTGLRKFHIHVQYPAPKSSPIPSLLLWVFTPDLLFSSSKCSGSRKDPTRAMKVFYKEQTYTTPQSGDPESALIEDVEIEDEVFEELGKTLAESKGVLPEGARRFQEWDVGLLERFSPPLG